MLKNLIEGAGKNIKKSLGGIADRTLARLTGAGIQTDSRILQSKARWSSKYNMSDWRVKVTIPTKANFLYNEIFAGNSLLEPLADTRGVFWPITPSMVIQHTASYNALGQTHSNYPFQAYQNSQVDQLNIVGEFPVQNSEDARHFVASIQFLRAVTKMFFGREAPLKGNPPPILHLNGYGEHMFSNVPVVVNTFNVELRSGIDYISTKGQSKNAYGGTTDYGYDPESSEPITWAPTLSLVSVLVTPVYSRDSVKNFSLQDFARGKLSGKQNGIGFI